MKIKENEIFKFIDADEKENLNRRKKKMKKMKKNED